MSDKHTSDHKLSKDLFIPREALLNGTSHSRARRNVEHKACAPYTNAELAGGVVPVSVVEQAQRDICVHNCALDHYEDPHCIACKDLTKAIAKAKQSTAGEEAADGP